jgi:hypothetical protein
LTKGFGDGDGEVGGGEKVVFGISESKKKKGKRDELELCGGGGKCWAVEGNGNAFSRGSFFLWVVPGGADQKSHDF